MQDLIDRGLTSPTPEAVESAALAQAWARIAELENEVKIPRKAELANAIFEYIEGFYNRRRRHSALGWVSEIGSVTRSR